MFDAGGGGGMATTPSAFDAIGRSMDAFAGGAAGGAIMVNESGGQALLTAIRNMMQWVDDNRGDLDRLADQPKLGSSHGAEVMKPYVASVATDGQGFIPMLLKFRDSLAKAEQGVMDAMKNYQAMDQDGARRHT